MTKRPGPRNGRLSAALALLLATITLGCATTGRPRREPVLDRLTVAEFIVTPTALEDADTTSRDWFRDLLVGTATKTAQRAALEWQLARVLEDNGGMSEETRHLSGFVSIPVALPPEYRGSHAAFRKGFLARARLELRNHRGDLVATAEAGVRWGQVRWTTGSPKTRRARRPEASLIDAVELAVERAVWQLLLKLHATAHAEEALGLAGEESHSGQGVPGAVLSAADFSQERPGRVLVSA